MLLNYFLKRFVAYFFLTLAGLIPLFASCDVVIRLASLPFSFQVLKLFWFMLPLICMFAIPIASCLAIGTTIGMLFTNNELLLLHYFPQARRKLSLAVFLFSAALAVVTIPLLFTWAPASYWAGKQFVIRAAQQQIENLPAKRFHTIASRCTIFFNEKNDEGFSDILLMVREKDGKRYVVTASSGKLEQGVLTLFDGTVYNHTSKNHCVATFGSLEIAFEKMFFQKADDVKAKATKFLSWSEIRERMREPTEAIHLREDIYEAVSDNPSDNAWKELHKRFLQLLWQLLLPLLMFWGMMIFSKQKSNILLSIVLSGALFLFSYISLNMAYFFLKRLWWTITIFYSIPWIVMLIFYKGYRKKWG